MSRVTFLPEEGSISDPRLVADLLDRIENCLDAGGSNTLLTGIRDSIKKSGSYTPNQMWRVVRIEEELDRGNEDSFLNEGDTYGE